MIIETPKLKRNIFILRKNGIRLIELNKDDNKKMNKEIPNVLTLYNKTKVSTINNINKKKKLFLENMISTEKKYFLEDYIRKKEAKMINDKNKKSYNLRKTFFSEEKIDTCRTSYFNKDIINYNNKKDKVPIMVKDIEANIILMKKNRNEKYKEYLKKKLELDLIENNKYYTDFNDKLGVKNVYIKTDVFYKKKKGFLNYNTNYFNIKDFKTFNLTYNRNRLKKLKIKIK